MSSDLVTYIKELSEPSAALDDIKQRPYAAELLADKPPNLEKMTIEQLSEVLKTSLFISAHTAHTIDEFAWKLGESEETSSKFLIRDPTTRTYSLKPKVPGYILQALESKIGHKQPFTSVELSLRYKEPNLHLAAKCGNARLFQYWLSQDHYKESFVFIAASQHPQVFASLPSKMRAEIPKHCSIVHIMPHIHVDVYERLTELKEFYSQLHVRYAVSAGRTDILEFLLDKKKLEFRSPMMYGSLKVCKFMFAKFGGLDEFKTYIRDEVKIGSLHDSDVIKYMHSQGVPLPVNIDRIAIAEDDVELYKLSHSDDTKISPDDIRRCIMNESIKCLEYILSRKVKVSAEHTRRACVSGNPNILRMILENVHQLSGLKFGLEFAVRKLKRNPHDRAKHAECINMIVTKIRSFRSEMLCVSCKTNKKLRFCSQCRVSVFCSKKCQQEARYKHEAVCKARIVPPAPII